MEADILRIILFVAGAALILGIYLADRFKHAGESRSRDPLDSGDQEEFRATEEIYHREPLWQEAEEESPIEEPLVYGESALQEPAFQESAHQELPIVQQTLHQEMPPPEEPIFTEPPLLEETYDEPLPDVEEDEEEDEEPLEDEQAANDQVEEELKRLGDLVNEEGGNKRAAKPEEPRAQQFSFRFFGSGNDSRQQKAAAPEPQLPLKIIQINIVPQEGRFSGDDILCAVSDVNMEYGEWGIYHSYDPASESDKPVFSLASMVEPGSFPIDRMEEFSTPGLTLFARLPGPKDGLTTFSELLFTAERLATLLEATLQDNSHSDLSKQTIEHMREEIQEYHRQLQLARSR